MNGQVLFNKSVDHRQLAIAAVPNQLKLGLLSSVSLVQADGSFRLQGLATGKTIVSLVNKRSGKALKTVLLDVTAPFETEYFFSTEKLLAIHGTVHDERGVAVPNAVVEAIAEDMSFHNDAYTVTSQTSLDGKFRLSGLQKRRYRVFVFRETTHPYTPCLLRRGVTPRGDPTNLELPAKAKPTALIKGTLSFAAAQRWDRVHLASDALRWSFVRICGSGHTRVSVRTAGARDVSARTTLPDREQHAGLQHSRHEPESG